MAPLAAATLRSSTVGLPAFYAHAPILPIYPYHNPRQSRYRNFGRGGARTNISITDHRDLKKSSVRGDSGCERDFCGHFEPLYFSRFAQNKVNKKRAKNHPFVVI